MKKKYGTSVDTSPAGVLGVPLGYCQLNPGSLTGKDKILYESRGTKCNGKDKGKPEDDLKDNRECPSIYDGETSRSLKERSAPQRLQKEQGRVIHDEACHPGSVRPIFHQFVINTFKSSL